MKLYRLYVTVVVDESLNNSSRGYVKLCTRYMFMLQPRRRRQFSVPRFSLFNTRLLNGFQLTAKNTANYMLALTPTRSRGQC